VRTPPGEPCHDRRYCQSARRVRIASHYEFATHRVNSPPIEYLRSTGSHPRWARLPCAGPRGDARYLGGPEWQDAPPSFQREARRYSQHLAQAARPSASLPEMPVAGREQGVRGLGVGIALEPPQQRGHRRIKASRGRLRLGQEIERDLGIQRIELHIGVQRPERTFDVTQMYGGSTAAMSFRPNWAPGRGSAAPRQGLVVLRLPKQASEWMAWA